MQPDHVVCKIHDKKLKFIQKGANEKEIKIFCKSCISEQNCQVDNNNFVKIKDAISEFKEIIDNTSQQSLYKKEQHDLINKKGYFIIDLLQSQQKIIEKLLQAINQEMMNDVQGLNILQQANKNNLNYKEVEIYAELYYKAKNNTSNHDQFQKSINAIVGVYLQEFSEKKTQIEKNLQHLQENSSSFKNYLKREEELMNLSVKFQCSTDLFEYLPSTQTLITANNCQFNILRRDQQQFKLQKSLQLNHQITQMALNPRSKQLYLGTKNQSILIYKYQNQTYELENTIITDDEIIKIILDPTDIFFIASSQNQTFIFDNVTMKLKQNLQDRRINFQDISCLEINSHGSYLILQNNDQLLLWDQQYSFWKLAIIQKVKKQTSICFLNSFQFFTLDSEGNIFLWEIKEKELVNTFSQFAIPGQLKFNQNLKILICYNRNLCHFYQLKESGELIFKKQKMGNQINFCLPQIGEELAFFDKGQINILQIKKMIQ